jgi:hypothetical protein
MASPETLKLQRQVEDVLANIKANREKDKQLSREVRRLTKSIRRAIAS